jgi:hypothetical protein
MYIYILWRIARQRFAKHVPERYAANKNRRPLLENGVGYHGITSISDTTTVLETLRAMISIWFSRSLKGEEFASQSISESQTRNYSATKINSISQPQWKGRHS